MTCRIGITTNPKRRQREWERKMKVDGFEVVGSYGSKAAAQRGEDKLAAQIECEAHHGGGKPKNPNAKWYLYRFDTE